MASCIFEEDEQTATAMKVRSAKFQLASLTNQRIYYFQEETRSFLLESSYAEAVIPATLTQRAALREVVNEFVRNIKV